MGVNEPCHRRGSDSFHAAIIGGGYWKPKRCECVVEMKMSAMRLGRRTEYG